MDTEKREDGWWITGVPDCEPCGPYKTRAEAMDDLRGLRRFFKYGHLRHYVTTDNERQAP